MFKIIEVKISEIQKSNKEISNRIEENICKREKYLDEIFLDIIATLDIFEREENIIEEKEWNKSEDSIKAIKRLLNTKKKLLSILDKYNVQKLVLPNSLSNDDLCIISDTEPDISKPNGYIISTLKNGYTRDGHILRRMEVVIIKN